MAFSLGVVYLIAGIAVVASQLFSTDRSASWIMKGLALMIPCCVLTAASSFRPRDPRSESRSVEAGVGVYTWLVVLYACILSMSGSVMAATQLRSDTRSGGEIVAGLALMIPLLIVVNYWRATY
jgi:hypothetical protein